MRNFKFEPNFLLNLSQAAIILGYKDYRKVETLIESGLLKAYRMPHSNRLKVKYHDVMKLPKEIQPDEN